MTEVIALLYQEICYREVCYKSVPLYLRIYMWYVHVYCYVLQLHMYIYVGVVCTNVCISLHVLVRTAMTTLFASMMVLISYAIAAEYEKIGHVTLLAIVSDNVIRGCDNEHRADVSLHESSPGT